MFACVCVNICMRGLERVIFGHDAMHGLQQLPFTGLDTGCVCGIFKTVLLGAIFVLACCVCLRVDMYVHVIFGHRAMRSLQQFPLLLASTLDVSMYLSATLLNFFFSSSAMAES